MTKILIADTPWHFLLKVILRSAFMFDSCYQTGEAAWIEKGNIFPDCEEDTWVLSEEP